MTLIFTKVSHVHDRKKQIYNLLDINLTLPREQSVAILAVHVRSAKAMLELACGIELPTRGQVQRYGSVSAPLGRDDFFHRELSGEQNLRFIAQIYGQNQYDFIKKVGEFTGLKKQLKQKAKDYPTAMKRKITLSASILMELDCYTVNSDLPEHPQKLFNKKLRKRFQHLTKHAQIIIASNNSTQIRQHAQSAVVIDANGCASFHDDVETGIQALDLLKQDTNTHAVE